MITLLPEKGPNAGLMQPKMQHQLCVVWNLLFFLMPLILPICQFCKNAQEKLVEFYKKNSFK